MKTFAQLKAEINDLRKQKADPAHRCVLHGLLRQLCRRNIKKPLIHDHGTVPKHPAAHHLVVEFIAESEDN